MARLKRISLWTALVLLIILLPIIVGGYWLLGTRVGAEWALSKVEDYAPVTIRYDELHGALWRGLSLRQLTVNINLENSPLKTIDAPLFSFRWNPVALFHSHLRLKELRLHNSTLVIVTDPQQPPSEGPPTLPQINLPISILVTGLDLSNNTLQLNGNPIVLPDANARVSLRNSRLNISKLDLRYQQSQILADASADFGKKLTFKIHETHNGDIALTGDCQSQTSLTCNAVLRWQDFSHGITGPVAVPQGKLKAELRDQQLEITASAALGYADIVDTPAPLNLHTRIDLDQQKLTLESLTAELLEGQFNASGELSWQAPLSAQLQAQLQTVDLSKWTQSSLGKTLLSLNTQTSLRMGDQLELSTSTEISQLKIKQHTVTGLIDAGLQGQQFQLEQLQLLSDTTRIMANGQYNLDSQAVTLELDSQIDNLSDLITAYAGKINSQLKIDGSLTKPHLKLTTQAQDLAVAPLKVSSLTLDTELRSNAESVNYPQLLKQLTIDKWQLDTEGLVVNQTTVDSASLSIQGDMDKHAIVFKARALPGAINVEQLNLIGKLSLPLAKTSNTLAWSSATWDIDLNQLTFNRPGSSNDRPIRLEKSTALSLSAKQSQAADLCLLHVDTRLCINQLSYFRDGNFKVDAALGGIYLDRERTLLPDMYATIPTGWDIDGELVAAIQAQGQYTDGQLRVTTDNRVAIEQAHISYRDKDSAENNQDYPLETVELTLNGNERQLQLAGLIRQQGSEPLPSSNRQSSQQSSSQQSGFQQSATEKTAAQQEIKIDGNFSQWATPQRAISLTLNGDLSELKPLQLALPSVRDLSGSAHINAQLKRESNQPEAVITGAVELRKFGLFIPESGTRVENLNVQLNAKKDNISIYGDGKVGDGSLNVDGQMVLNAEQELVTKVALKSDRITLVNLPDSRLNASTNLQLDGSGLNQWHLSGDVTAMDSFLHLQEVPSTAVRVSSDAEIFGTEQAQKKTPVIFTADIQLIAGNNINFTGFGLATDISGRLQFTRDANQTNQLHGALTIPNGRFKAYGQDLGVENGQIIFAGSTSNPSLDIRAARVVDQITAGIWLHGSARNLKTSLYSQPDMSNSETLSYILTGKPLNKSPDDEGTDMEAAALALGLKQALPALQKIGSQIGLTDISVESGAPGEGSSLAAGKRLNDRLYVKYQYGLSGAVGRLVIEYALSKRLKLEASPGASGESDTFDITYTWNSTPPELRDKKAEAEQASEREK